MRLIDGDALMETINRHCYPIRHDMTSIEPGMTRIGILQVIQEQPTIEPERTKGNWVGIDDEPCDEWECDRCGFIYDGSPPPNFCENCGADMRGENDDIPKKGKWIEYDNSHCECPFCHEEWSYFDNEVEYFNYCPNCGCLMTEE